VSTADTTPEALTQDDVQLLNETADFLAGRDWPNTADGLRDIARRIAASIEVAS
jgi:hypothetical protein